MLCRYSTVAQNYKSHSYRILNKTFLTILYFSTKSQATSYDVILHNFSKRFILKIVLVSHFPVTLGENLKIHTAICSPTLTDHHSAATIEYRIYPCASSYVDMDHLLGSPTPCSEHFCLPPPCTGRYLLAPRFCLSSSRQTHEPHRLFSSWIMLH